MLRLWPKTVALLMVTSVSAWGMPPQNAPLQRSVPKKVAKKPVATTPVVQQQPVTPPPPPPTPEQMPAQTPQVAFSNGMLSITSQNSTLGDILTAVRRQTGATVELPPGASAERVAARLGPGQPKDVIASLLNGSRFDYIILGSLRRPGGIERVILTQRQNQAQPQMNAQNAPMQGGQQPGVQPGAQPGQEAESEEDNAPERDAVETDSADQEQPDQQQEQPPAQQNQPYQPVPVPQAQQPDQQNQQNQQNSQQPRVKTPEELLRELQQMRNQQSNPQQNPPPQQQPQSNESPQ